MVIATVAGKKIKSEQGGGKQRLKTANQFLHIASLSPSTEALSEILVRKDSGLPKNPKKLAFLIY